MATINELITKRANLWENAKAFLDEHTDKDGRLSAEDAAAYDKMEADVLAFGKNIERLERQEHLDAKLSQPMAKPIADKPQTALLEIFQAADNVDEYRQSMLTAFRTKFRKIDNVLEEKTDANGGYLVPDEWDKRLVDILDEENIMRSLGTTITTSGEHKINITATKPAASWIEEGGSLVFADATFGQKVLDAYKLHVAIKVTEELLFDNAFNLESYIIDQFGKAIANAEEDAFLNGNGVGKPTGLFTEAAVTVPQASITTAGSNIASDDVISLIYSLKRPYRRSASFIMNDRTLGAIRKLKDNNNAYMWQPSYQSGEPDRLLGYTVHTSAYAPIIEAGKPCMAFGDYSYYNIGDRGTRSVQELKELFAGNGMIGYVMKERVDGKLVLNEAVKFLKMKS